MSLVCEEADRVLLSSYIFPLNTVTTYLIPVLLYNVNIPTRYQIPDFILKVQENDCFLSSTGLKPNISPRKVWFTRLMT